MVLKLAQKLRERGVLGINQRNLDFLAEYNARRLYPLVDDKVKTKELAKQAGVAVPELYALIEIQHQLRELPALLAPYPDFVIKPARGSGGEGIVVIASRSRGSYRTSSGRLITAEELEHHVSMILAGVHSLGGHPDKAIVEYRVKFDERFEEISFQGVPDIRTLLLLGVPVMSMIRLPTRQSDGKANLHQGAVGAGIDLLTGMTVNAVWRNEIIRHHPDTGADLIGVQIPEWDQMLNLAAKTYAMTGLGYQGVDLVIDKEKGPLLLELNARPGLNIQIANSCGLLHRLRLVENKARDLKTPEERVAFARENFK
jgi:alpha-L-glutamate ligase-like protein